MKSRIRTPRMGPGPRAQFARRPMPMPKIKNFSFKPTSLRSLYPKGPRT